MLRRTDADGCVFLYRSVIEKPFYRYQDLKAGQVVEVRNPCLQRLRQRPCENVSLVWDREAVGSNPHLGCCIATVIVAPELLKCCLTPPVD